MHDEGQLSQEVEDRLQMLLSDGLKALLIVSFNHDSKVTVLSASDGCGTRLIIIKGKFSEAHTLLQDSYLNEQVIL